MAERIMEGLRTKSPQEWRAHPISYLNKTEPAQQLVYTFEILKKDKLSSETLINVALADGCSCPQMAWQQLNILVQDKVLGVEEDKEGRIWYSIIKPPQEKTN